MKKEEDKPEQGVNVSLAEEIYDAFANWYHDDGSYDTFLRSEAWGLIEKYASQFKSVSGEGKEAVEFAEWLTTMKVDRIGGGMWEVDIYENIAPNGKTGISPCLSTEQLYQLFKKGVTAESILESKNNKG